MDSVSFFLKSTFCRFLKTVFSPLLGQVRCAASDGFILLYHRVGDDVDWAYPPLPTEHFYAHMEEIDRFFCVLPLSELLERRARGQSIKGCCSVTFDDGYADFIKVVPVLDAFDFHVTHFLVQECLANGRPTWNLRARRLKRNAPAAVPLEMAERLQDLLGSLSALERERCLSAWESTADLPSEPTMLRAEHLRECGTRVEFGSHTRTHANLGSLDECEMRAELRTSRELLGQTLSSAPRYVSYPNSSWNETVVRIAQEEGYQAALAVGQRVIRSSDSQFALPRIDVGGLWGDFVRLERFRVLDMLRGVLRAPWHLDSGRP